MSRVDGTSRKGPLAGADRKGTQKPAEEGEFDRVLEEREGGAADTASKAAKARGAAGATSLRGGVAGKGDPTGGTGGEPATEALARRAQSRGLGQLSGPPLGPALGQPAAGSDAAPGEVPAEGAGDGAPTSLAATGLGEAGVAARSGEAEGSGQAAVGQPLLGPGGSKVEAAVRHDRATTSGDETRVAAGDELDEEKPPEAPAVAIPLPPTATLPVAAVDTTSPPSAPGSDPALVRQVAQQVLAGIEVHLVAGRTQVDLGLDLGALGQAQVELARGTGAGLQVTFKLDTAEAQLAVASNLPELVQALEQKGYAPTIDLRGGDGSALSGRDPGQDQARQQAMARDQGQGRSRGQYVPPPEEEG